MSDITKDELKKKLKEVVIIDVREPDETGGIEGAKKVPLGKLIRDLGRLDLPKDKEIVCYCQGGTRGGIAAEFLKIKGFKARNLVGGLREFSA